MKYKLVTTDFDDTLLKDDLTISEYSIDVIKAFKQKGGVFAVSTGRMFSSIYPNLISTGLNDGLVISYNGALFTEIETCTHIKTQYIDYKTSYEHLLQLEKDATNRTQIYYNDKLYAKENSPEIEDYHRICGVAPIFTGENLSNVVLREKWSLQKILSIMPPDRASKYLTYYRGEGAHPKLDYSLSKPYFFEAMSKGVNKGEALKTLCKMNSIDISESMAFGDGYNDIEMLQAAGISFAVENANELTKKSASGVCESNNNDGVAKMIEKYCL